MTPADVLAAALIHDLRGLLDRAYATLGTDAVADLFVGTDDEDAYEEFMTEAYAALCSARRFDEALDR